MTFELTKKKLNHLVAQKLVIYEKTFVIKYLLSTNPS